MSERNHSVYPTHQQYDMEDSPKRIMSGKIPSPEEGQRDWNNPPDKEDTKVLRSIYRGL
jgi:hypothetical protein